MQQTKETYHAHCEGCPAEEDISSRLWDPACGRDIPVPFPNNDLPLWCAIYPKADSGSGWESLQNKMHLLAKGGEEELLEAEWVETHIVDGWWGGGMSYIAQCPKCAEKDEAVAVLLEREDFVENELGIVEAIVAMKRGW